jgi:phage terminase small subunit
MDVIVKKKPGLPSRLTPMQMKFAELLVYFEGRKYAYECAIEAGYAEGKNALGARVESSRLQNPKLFPHVVKYIGELKEERNKKYGVSYGGHLTELGKIRDQALKDRSYSAATVAEKARGQVGGLYIEQKIIRTGKVEDLTEEELDNRIANIVDDNSRIIESKEDSDIDPNDIKPKLPLA